VPRLQTDRPNFIGLLRVIGTEERYSPGPLRHVDGFPVLRLLWGLRRSLASLGDLHPSTNELPTFTQMDSTKSCRWRLSDNPSRSLRYPDWKQGNSGRLPHPLGWYLVGASLGRPCGHSRCLVSARALISQLCRLLRGRGIISRRLKPASFEFTMRLLSLAPRLGGLHRASWVPIRASSFTSGVHPPDATAHRLIACLYRLWRFPRIPSVRFVAHTKLDLMPAIGGYSYSIGWVRTSLPYQL
jgi:hypothetical protein